MEFVWVPGGCFEMGQTEKHQRFLLKYFENDLRRVQKRYANELPLHEVCIDGFWLGKFEVSQKIWRLFRDDFNWKSQPDYPIRTASWTDASDFAKYITNLNIENGYIFRLPTEAEWEYACNGGEDFLFCGGDLADEVSWNDFHPTTRLNKLASLDSNWVGAFDMSGNSAEWCMDSYSPVAYRMHTKVNPFVVLLDTDLKVIRGGHYQLADNLVRSTARMWESKEWRFIGYSFRLVMSSNEL